MVPGVGPREADFGTICYWMAEESRNLIVRFVQKVAAESIVGLVGLVVTLKIPELAIAKKRDL
jgi:hypothetical protein